VTEFLTANFVVIALLLFMAFLFTMTLWAIMTANGKQYKQLAETIENERGRTSELFSTISTLTNLLNETQYVGVMKARQHKKELEPRRMHRSDADEHDIETEGDDLPEGAYRPAPIDSYGV